MSADKAHAVARAAERYGLRLTAEDLGELRDRIEGRGPGTRLIRDLGRGKAKWEVGFRGAALRLVYDRLSRRIVTLLPAKGRAGGMFRMAQVLSGPPRGAQDAPGGAPGTNGPLPPSRRPCGHGGGPGGRSGGQK